MNPSGLADVAPRCVPVAHYFIIQHIILKVTVDVTVSPTKWKIHWQ